MLLLSRMTVFGVRLENRCLLLRRDVPADLVETKKRVEAHLRGSGLELVQAEADLGDVAAIQIAGIRGGTWDLWGDDATSAHEALKVAVLGDDGPLEMGPVGDMAPGMTLEDLLDDLSERKER